MNLTDSSSAWPRLTACFPGSWGSSGSPPEGQHRHVTVLPCCSTQTAAGNCCTTHEALPADSWVKPVRTVFFWYLKPQGISAKHSCLIMLGGFLRHHMAKARQGLDDCRSHSVTSEPGQQAVMHYLPLLSTFILLCTYTGHKAIRFRKHFALTN